MFKPNRFTLSFNNDNPVLELYNPTTTYYQNAVNITQTKLTAQLTYLNQDTKVIEYVYNNIKYIALFKFEFKSKINISCEIITNDIKDLTELDIVLTHTKYCKLKEVEGVQKIQFYDDNNSLDTEPVILDSIPILLKSSTFYTCEDKEPQEYTTIVTMGLNCLNYLIIQGYLIDNELLIQPTIRNVAELYFKSTNAEQLNPGVKIEFYADDNNDMLFESIIINCKQDRYKYDESGIVLPIYDITVEVDGKQRQIEAFELGTNCYKL